MIKITKEKEVNRELLESALTIVIDDDIIKPEIITSEERVVGHPSDYPEVEYTYKDKGYRLALLPEFFLDSTIATVAGIIRFQASKYFREYAGEK
nr:MAG TPA: hypothetical protein [Bacteriophage sp.]